MVIEILKRSHKNVQASRINYVFGSANDAKVKDVEFIGSSCLSPSPLSEINEDKVIDKAKLARLIKEMSLPNEFNQRAKMTSDHIVISLANKEILSNEDWLIIIKDYLEDMGYGDCTWLATKHNDTDYQHAHIVLNNLKYDEEKFRYVQVKNNNNRQRSMKARIKIESLYGCHR
jgi:hypothetical protein